MKAEDLRKRFNGVTQLKDDVLGDDLHGFPPESARQKRISELFCIVSDIILYLAERETVSPTYVPEPRLGPQPESEEQAIERGNKLAEIIRVAEQKLTKAEVDEMVKSTEEMTSAIEAEGVLIDDARDEEPKLCTTSGDPVDEVRANQTQETGQYKGYIVLCPDERAKGFVRPYRDSYRHTVCGTVTTMGRALSETYARDPSFYGGTFCTGCNKHLPVAEFVWTADGQPVGS